MLPEWMPNSHPMIVHFPIALIITGFLIDIVGLFFRRVSILPRMSTVLYGLGALGAIFSVISGESAAETVEVAGQASAILADHEDIGEITMWFFSIYALLRIVLWWQSFRLTYWIPLAVIGGIGLVPLYQASSFGGRLVYERGIGVAAVDSMASLLQEKERALARLNVAAEFSGLEENGAWKWQAGTNAAHTFESAFDITMGEVVAETVAGAEGGSLLALTVRQSPVLITYGSPVSNVEFLAVMDLSEFNGSVRLIHHAQDSLSYHFMEVGDGQVALGVLAGGEEEIQEENAWSTQSETVDFRIVGDKTHFRGYVDGNLLVHGHGPAPGPGVAGFVLMGSGTITFEKMELTVLR